MKYLPVFRFCLPGFGLVLAVLVNFICSVENVAAVVTTKRISIVIHDSWKMETKEDWKPDYSLSSQSLITLLKTRYPDYLIINMEQPKDSGFSEYEYISLAKEQNVDLLLVGSTQSSVKEHDPKEINPWLVQSNDPLLDQKRYSTTVVCQWRLLDLASNSVVGIISESFSTIPTAGGQKAYNSLAAKDWAKNQAIKRSNLTLTGILETYFQGAIKQNYEIVFEQTSADDAQRIADQLKHNSLIAKDSMQLIKAYPEKLVFGCTVLERDNLSIVNTMLADLPERYQIIQVEDGRLTVGLKKDREKTRTIVSKNTRSEVIPVKTKTVNLTDNNSNYHALIIGINKYMHMPRLKTAIADARDISELLQKEYKFNTTLLIDPERAAILESISHLRKTLKPEDNLLIYYAGHGWLDQDADEGYWLPADAENNNMAKWISNATITSQLRAIKAKHIFVVADSCYSGKLTRGVNIKATEVITSPVQAKDGDYYELLLKKKSRTVLSSGGLEVVSDKGEQDNSIFAYAFMMSLSENGKYLEGKELYQKTIEIVTANSDQTPQYSEIKNAGHHGGSFVFIKQ